VSIDTVIFDLGGVLVDWNPRYLYRSLLGSDAEVEAFLTTVCTQAWNEKQDAGRPWAEAVAELSARFPQHAGLIAAYDERWGEMVSGAVTGSANILRELVPTGVRLLALTNWSAEKFPIARARFDFLRLFEGIVVSGEEGTRKPHVKLYEILFERFGVTPQAAVFIDDSAANVATGRRLGLRAIQFAGAEALRAELVALRLL